MMIKFRIIIMVMMGTLVLSACQTTPKVLAEVETERLPIVETTVEAPIERLDSDGDGVYDESDVCPDTDRNLIVDDKGCPISFTFHMGEENINKSRVLYLENSSEISVIDNDKLDSIVEVLREYPDSVLLIDGHTGKFESNSDSLAKNRAERLKNHMILSYDIENKRIATYACRYYLPIASNDDLETRYMNQRAEIELGTKIHDGSSSCERFNY